MQWELNIQEVLDLIEGELINDITLEKVAKHIGYSEYYTTRRFKNLTGSTLRRYIQLRRISDAALELRDTDNRIIDIAFKYGYSSQEAFTKSFTSTFNITPGEYRRSIVPLNLTLKKNLIFNNKVGGIVMDFKKEIEIKKITLPKHKIVMLKRMSVNNYMDFWRLVDKEDNMDCDELHGYLTSLPGLYKEPFGALYFENGKEGYMFCMAISFENDLTIRKEFDVVDVDEMEYLVFEHPKFNESSFEEVLSRTRKLAINYDPSEINQQFDSEYINYYEHSGLTDNYYFIRRPLKKTK